MSDESITAVLRGVLAELREEDVGELVDTVAADLSTAIQAPIRAAVLGAMKAGKSSLVNTLLAVPSAVALPRDVLQTTAQCVTVVPAHTPRKGLRSTDGGHFIDETDDARWDGLVRGNLVLPPDGSLEVGVATPWFVELGLEFVDTPGVNSPTEGMFDRTWSIVGQSQLALYVLSAPEGFQASDLEFIQAVQHHAGGFIFVISQFDRLGAKDSQDAVVRRVVDDYRVRLREVGVDEPFAMCATSCAIDDDMSSGFGELRRAIRDATSWRRSELVHRAVARSSLRRFEAALERLRAEPAALELRLATDRGTFRERRGELEARLITARGDFDGQLRGIGRRVNAARLGVLEEVAELSSATVEKVEARVDGARTVDELGSLSRGALRSDLDAWREECTQAVARGGDAVERAAGIALDEVKAGLKTTLNQVFKKDVVLDEPAEAVGDGADATSKGELEQLRRKQAYVKQELATLKDHLASAGDSDELNTELAGALSQLEALPYEPVMQAHEVDRGAETLKKVFKGLGTIGDLALIAVPIPAKEMKFLAKVSKGGNLLNAAKKYNTLVAKKKAALGAVGALHPVLGKALDALSLEHWGEQLGGFLGDALLPNQVVEIEDPAVKRAHLAAVKPIRDRVHELRLQVAEAERSSQMLSRRYEDIVASDRVLTEEVQRLERRSEQDAQERLAQLREVQLSEAKVKILAAVRKQLIDPRGDGWYARLRTHIETEFERHRQDANVVFERDAQRSIDELKADLAVAEASYGQDESTVRERIVELESRVMRVEQACARLRSAL